MVLGDVRTVVRRSLGLKEGQRSQGGCPACWKWPKIRIQPATAVNGQFAANYCWLYEAFVDVECADGAECLAWRVRLRSETIG